MTGSSTQGIKTVLHPASDLATTDAAYAAGGTVKELASTVLQTDGTSLELLG